MKSEETWKYIHGERSEMADTLGSLSSDQWSTPSWCQGWSVQDAAGHILAAAEQTPLNFYKELLMAAIQIPCFHRPRRQAPGGHRPRRAGASVAGPDHHHQPSTGAGHGHARRDRGPW